MSRLGGNSLLRYNLKKWIEFKLFDHENLLTYNFCSTRLMDKKWIFFCLCGFFGVLFLHFLIICEVVRLILIFYLLFFKGTYVVSQFLFCCWCSCSKIKGIVGGSWFNDVGSATSYLCLPHDPNFGGHTIPRYGNGKLYGAEYETCDEPECDLTPSCAVCRISRESYFMLPARNTCYPGWTFEYSGYIMASYPSHSGGTEYICVDSSLNYTEGSGGDQNGAMLHYTAYVCGSLPCPPYIEHRVVVCVVCSK